MVTIAWYKVDDGFHSSHKVLSIPRSVRLPAVGLWTLAGAWSADQELDGFIPGFMVTELGGTPRVVTALVKAGLWDEVDPDGYQYRNWGEYQPTRAELEASRAKEAERKRRYREQQNAGNGPSPGDDQAVTEARSSVGRGSVKARSTSTARPRTGNDQDAKSAGSRGKSGRVPAGHQQDSARDTTGSPHTPTRPDPTRPLTDNTDQSSHLSETGGSTDPINPSAPASFHARIVANMGIELESVRDEIEKVLAYAATDSDIARLCAHIATGAKEQIGTGYVIKSIRNQKQHGKWRKVLAGEAVA